MVKKPTNYQNIDRLIHGIKSIIEDRCSLLDEDVNLLNEVIALLEKLKRKRKKGRTDNIDLMVKVVELLTKFLLMSNEINHVVDLLK
ncbi:MAG TPA: hypothetical protein VI757_12240 [Bacteroidia bacterium]|nr:hypothetical protein [Bacteroidia bacterium]